MASIPQTTAAPAMPRTSTATKDPSTTIPPPIHPNDLQNHPPWTHIIIGGGTAGLVLAHRLSSPTISPPLRVLILEAGPPAFSAPEIDIPGKFGESLGGAYDWKFETTAQEGIGGRKLKFPRGKVLGGTSALNFMTWNRGCREDYDAWEKMGNKGWGWDELLHYFKASERLNLPSEDHQRLHSSFINPADHGTDGPMPITHSAVYSAAHAHWHATFHALGIPTNKANTSGSTVGAWTALTAVDPVTRTRSYAAKNYYAPVAHRENLGLVTGAVVQEVVLRKTEKEDAEKGEEWTATGVRFTYEGKEYTVNVTHEVIVSCGSVQSPQLLELSGIGNPDILKAAGIEVKVNNPNVGENLQEHMTTIYEIDPSIASPEMLRFDHDLASAALKEYQATQSGVLTAIPSSIAYLPCSTLMPAIAVTSLAQRAAKLVGADHPLAKQFTYSNPSGGVGQMEYNFDVSNYSDEYVSEKGKRYATMLQMLQYPFSKGSIHIPPLSPAMQKEGKRKVTVDDKPAIDPRYYLGSGGEIDFQIMVAAQKFGTKITATPPLSTIILRRVFPPETSSFEEEDEVLEEFVRNHTITDWHPVGTCGMGGFRGRKGGVVDERLRVYGVRGLRVCDASVLPLQVGAHIQASVYAVAEKGAAMVAEDWEQLQKIG